MAEVKPEDDVDMAAVDDKSESESDNDEEEADNKKKLQELDEILMQDSYNYDTHVAKIDLLKRMSELDELRSSRERFAELFPLSPDLWISWLKDEQSLAVSPEEKQGVIELYERAVKDYVSVKVWLEYCQFMLGEVGTEEGRAKAREVFERAIAAVGLNVAEGSLIWESYREFELALLSLASTDKEKKAQNARMNKLFQRQLSIPQLNMETILAEFKTFADGNIDKASYAKAKKMLADREAFENGLLRSAGKNDEQLKLFAEYLEFEKKESMPARIQNLFERRVTDHCLEVLVWTEYIDYLAFSLKDAEQTLATNERASRNCPWDVKIWISYIRNLERFKRPIKEVNVVFEKGLAGGLTCPSYYLDIWLTYIDYRHRIMNNDAHDEKNKEEKEENIRDLFAKAVDNLVRVQGDPECKMARYWAQMEGDMWKNMEEARKIWSDILSSLGTQAKYWLEYINLEKNCGDTKHLMKLYPRALDKCTDFPELIGEAWLQFEREEGTLEDFEKAEKKIKLRIEKIAEIRKAEKEASDAKIEKKKAKDKDKRRERRLEESEAKRKRKNDEQEDLEPKKPKLTTRKDDDSFKKPAMPVVSSSKTPVQPPPGYDKSVAPPPGFKADSQEPSASDGNQKFTLFVSNLDYRVEEEELKNFFTSFGNVKEVRLVKHASGQSKGFAYVEMSSNEDVEKALARDNELVRGRPMYIAKSDPNKKGHQFKYSMGLEKKKIFIKGLPTSATKEEVTEMFEPYGRLHEVRLVTYRNGHFKGIAYVEFEQEKDASQAILKTDGKTVRDKTISVALSNPPERKKPAEFESVKSLGGGKKASSSTSTQGPKTQVSFVPSALLRKPKSSAAAPNAQENDRNGTKVDGGDAKKKSNADFRSLFLAKK